MCRKVVSRFWPWQRPVLYDDATEGIQKIHTVVVETTSRSRRYSADVRTKHHEELCRTPRGSWFVLFHWSDGSTEIEPLSPREARAWLLENVPPRSTLIELGLLGKHLVDA